MANIDALRDDFADGPDASLWNVGGFTQGSGYIDINATGGIVPTGWVQSKVGYVGTYYPQGLFIRVGPARYPTVNSGVFISSTANSSQGFWYRWTNTATIAVTVYSDLAGSTNAGGSTGNTTNWPTYEWWYIFWDSTTVYFRLASAFDYNTMVNPGGLDMALTGWPYNWTFDPNNIIIKLGATGASSNIGRFYSVNPPPPPLIVNATTLTGSGRTPAPTSWIHATSRLLSGSGAAIAPAIDLHLPQDVILTATTLTGSGMTQVPSFLSLPNTYVYPPTIVGTAQAFAPASHTVVYLPTLTGSGAALSLQSAGSNALSRYAQTVLQTPDNYEGAVAYYRMSDAGGVNMMDIAGGQYNGTWVGTRGLGAGAIVGDSDQSMGFDGTTTQGRIGVLPALNVLRDDPRTMSGNVDPFQGSNPNYSGAGVEIWFDMKKVGDTSEQYLVARNFDWGPGNETMSIKVLSGVVVARSVAGSDSYDIAGTGQVNDGNWHQAFLTIGRTLIDETPGGAGMLRLYVDGALAASRQVPPSSSWFNDVWVGSFGSTTHYYGNLDELSWYDYAPTEWEVKEHWLQATGQGGPKTQVFASALRATGDVPDPSTRLSPVIPLNDFYDDFDFLDLQKWRDQIGAQVQGGALQLQCSGERVLTPDYFQTKDSTFIVEVTKLPVQFGNLRVSLVNECDNIPDWMYGGNIQFDTFRRHREIGFELSKQVVAGRTRYYLMAYTDGTALNGGSKQYTNTVNYIPDDPNHPSPMKWWRLDIEPGVNGGATWYYSGDGVAWTQFYDVHGGQVNISSSTEVTVSDGQLSISQTQHANYENEQDFRLFEEDLVYPEETAWRGYMRVRIQAALNSNPAAFFLADNVNVEPEGSGTTQTVSANRALALTTSTNSYLDYVLNPRHYTSARDVDILPGPITGSGRVPGVWLPVRLSMASISGSGRLVAPVRGGDAIPIQIAVDGPCAGVGSTLDVVWAGTAQPRIIQSPGCSGSGIVLSPDDVNTTGTTTLVETGYFPSLTITTRPVLVGITQN